MVNRVVPLASIVVMMCGAALVWCVATACLAKEESIKIDTRYLDSTLPMETRIDILLSQMTLREKIGQMALVEKNSIFYHFEIASYGLGGLLSGSGAKPASNTAEGWYEMTREYQAAAATSRLGIPLLYGSDAIHGHAHVPGATVFPHAIGLGATGDPQLVEAVAAATARELVATGVNWNYAPNLDLPRDIRWGRVYETFSDDPILAATLGSAYLRGLQGKGSASGTIAVLGTLKHYVGLGSMTWGSSQNDNFKIDQGVVAADEAALRAEYLPPFVSAIDAGALSVMVGLHLWGEDKAVTDKYLLTTVLKEELDFSGFVVSDWYGVYEGQFSRFFATVRAINAGVDMVMLPFDYITFTRHVSRAVWLGLIPEARIDDAVRRILRAKFALGLLDEKKPVVDLEVVGSTAHRALARAAVAKSQVLVKNEGNLLPLSPNTKRMYVAGSAADNVGKQSGAWNVEWQGVDGNWVPGGTSILAGIKAAVGENTVVRYSQSGLFDKNVAVADVGIAVVGESPYAEGWGDKAHPVISAEDLEAISNLQAISKQVVVVLVSGRPLLIANEVEDWDALIAAWLPGSEGAGVADVMFGAVPFTGTLPLPWPHHSEQLPIMLDGTTADGTQILFPRYYRSK